MAVHQLSETPIRAPLRLVATAEDAVDRPDDPKLTPTRADREANNVAVLVQATATMVALARILSVRFILLLSIVGAFTMALFVVLHPTWPALVVMALYACVVGGMIALESGLLAKLKE